MPIQPKVNSSKSSRSRRSSGHRYDAYALQSASGHSTGIPDMPSTGVFRSVPSSSRFLPTL
jgi:hypothetical protein